MKPRQLAKALLTPGDPPTTDQIKSNLALATEDIAGLQTALDGKANSAHSHAAGDITSGTMATARLGSGTANGTTFLRGDQTWAVPTASVSWGTITGTLSSQTDLQTALDLKAPLASPTFTGAVVLPSATSIGTVSNTEISYLDGVTSAIQTQIDGKAASSHTHTASQISDSTAAGRSMLTAADAAAQTALLNNFTTALKGLAPASGGGTANFLRADGTWAAPPAGGSIALTDLTDVTIASAAQGQVLTRGASEFQNLTLMTVTLGPFQINDLPGTATTQATLGYFNTATALSRNANDMRMDRAGRVVGLIVVSDATRTAGTATARVRIAGAGTTFNSGAVVIDATNTTSDSSFVSWANGVAFTAGQTIGADVVTSGWTPTTANLNVYVVVMFDPF